VEGGVFDAPKKIHDIAHKYLARRQRGQQKQTSPIGRLILGIKVVGFLIQVSNCSSGLM
jgi:hypothetical protein